MTPTMSQEFVVYSKDGCPYCEKVVTLLQFAELKHVVFPVLDFPIMPILIVMCKNNVDVIYL